MARRTGGMVIAGLVPSEACERGSSPGLSPWLSLHMAFSLCMCLSVQISLYMWTQSDWIGPTLHQHDLILTNYICNNACFQIRSHSEVLGVRTRTYKFVGWGMQFNP